MGEFIGQDNLLNLASVLPWGRALADHLVPHVCLVMVKSIEDVVEF